MAVIITTSKQLGFTISQLGFIYLNVQPQVRNKNSSKHSFVSHTRILVVTLTSVNTLGSLKIKMLDTFLFTPVDY